MAVQFSVPKSPQRSVYEIKELLGVDFTNTEINIDDSRSPNAPNMIRHVPGKVRKRMGYQMQHSFSGTNKIYGAHVLKNIAAGQSFDDITDVNRAKNTSDTYSIYTDYVWHYIYFYECFATNEVVNIAFDYECNEIAYATIDHETVTLPATTEPTHYSASFNASDSLYFFSVANSGSGNTLKIKNVMVCHAVKTGLWSAAPEDSGNDFDYDRLYSYQKSICDNSFDTGYKRMTVQEDAEYYYEIITVNNSTLSGSDKLRFEFDININFASDNTAQVKELYVSPCYKNSNGSLMYFDMRNLSKLNSSIGHMDIGIPISDQYDGDSSYKISKIRLKIKWSAGIAAIGGMNMTDMSLRPANFKTSYDSYSSNALIHCGNKLYKQNENTHEYTSVYNNMNRSYSTSWQFGQILYLVDGKGFLRYEMGAAAAQKISDNPSLATIPVVSIGRSPDGKNAISYYPYNLIGSGFTDKFYVDHDHATTKQFYVSQTNLDSTAVKARVLQQDGTWRTYTQGSGLSVNTILGLVEFTTAPGESPITGEDNVEITAYKTFSGYADRINKCTIGTIYGTGGAANRLFLSGNPDYPNQDWWSETNDFTYFPDENYGVLGSETSAIVGYSIINNMLVTHKDANEDGRAAFVREGVKIPEQEHTTTIDGESTTTTTYTYQFNLVNTIQGEGAIAKRAFGYMSAEPLFLTKLGVYAFTSQDITGEKYGQNRSFYVNGKLLNDGNLSDAFAVVYNDMYFLNTNGHIYVLDGLQPVQTDKSLPYATRQYSCFYLDLNLPNDTPTCMWVDEGELWFGTTTGKIYKFYNNIDSLYSYNDDGRAIDAWWETPDVDGKLFYKNKTFRYLALRMMASVATSVEIYGMKRGIWSLIKRDTSSGRSFTFSGLIFSKLSFSTDTSAKVASTKIRIKKVDKARFKFENKELNEPFGLFNIALEYVESGNHKG